MKYPQAIPSKSSVLVNALLGIVFILVLFNILSPLRLNTDSLRYLNIMLYLKGLLPPNDWAGQDFFPHGYPIVLQALSFVGLLTSGVIIAINILAGLTAGYCINKVLPGKSIPLLTILILLSFINIKHLTLPTADELFTGILLVACWCWSVVLKGKWYFILPAIILTAAALYLRTAGIVIVSGVVLCLIYKNWLWLLKQRSVLILITGLALALVVIFLMKLSSLEQKNDYFRQLDLEHLLTGPDNLLSRLVTHLQEMGEFMINAPYSKLSTLVPHGMAFLVMPGIIVMGLFTLAFIIFIAFKAKLYQYLITWVYLCYLLMLLLWPFYDGRFLIPIIPFFIYSLYLAWQQYGRYLIIKALAGIYMIMGIFSLLYSTAISVDQKTFLKLYGSDKNLSGMYKTHFEDKRSGRKVNYDINKDRVMYLLDHYDK